MIVNTFTRATADPAAIRQQLAIEDPLDIHSSAFMRFVIRFSEHLDVDIPPKDYPMLLTVSDCLAYVAVRTGRGTKEMKIE